MPDVFDQYRYNVSPGPEYCDESALPSTPPIVSSTSAKVIAFYLPQFHTISENDEWWGVGFTEWTQVTKALPRYLGHRQPKLPSDLGFYDLSRKDALQRQVDLAKRAGIHGFCIHDYWFAGRKVLETPLRNLLANPDIDLPFCLSWANENWSRRWDGSEDQILLQQVYDDSDLNGYVRSILPALRDPRYITVDGRPLILIYRPGQIPNARNVFESWRAFLISEGLPDPYLAMAQSFRDFDPRPYGLDAAVGFPPHGSTDRDFRDHVSLLDREFVGQATPYEYMVQNSMNKWTSEYRCLPGVAPGWDNDARKPGRGIGFYGSSPTKYAEWLASAVEFASQAPNEERLVFVNAWNEWAEAAVLEPDRHYGHAYLVATRQVVDPSLEIDLPAMAAYNDPLERPTLSRFAERRTLAREFLGKHAYRRFPALARLTGHDKS